MHRLLNTMNPLVYPYNWYSIHSNNVDWSMQKIFAIFSPNHDPPPGKIDGHSPRLGLIKHAYGAQIRLIVAFDVYDEYSAHHIHQ